MQNYAYDRVNTLAAHEAERQKLAAQMDEYVTSGGTIKIIEGFQYRPIPERTWNNNQGNRSAEDASRRRGVKSSAASKRAGGNTNKHREQRRRNVELIKPLLDQGLSSYQIAPLVGLTDRSVRNIISMEGLRDRP